MKLYPYSNIQTDNLKPLLFASRLLALIAYILFLVAVITGIKAIFGSFGGIEKVGNLTLTRANTSGATSLLVVWEVITSLGIIMVSGLGAAIVSIENKYLTKEKIE